MPIGFLDLPLALLEGRGEFRSKVDELADRSGTKPNVVAECSSSTQLALLVAQKECGAILPSFAGTQLDKNSTDSYTLEGFKELERNLCFAWSPNRAEIRPVVERAARLCGELC